MIDAYSLPLKDEGILDIAAEAAAGRSSPSRTTTPAASTPKSPPQIAETGAEIKLKNLFVHQIPKSGREPQDVLDYLGLGEKAILAAV